MVDYRNSKWRPPKPEVEITFERQAMAPDSNDYPRIIDHTRLRYVTANIPQRCRLPKSKMADIRLERQAIAPRFQLVPHIFGLARLEYYTVDIDRHCLTLPDFGQLHKIKMAVTETGNGNND